MPTVWYRNIVRLGSFV